MAKRKEPPPGVTPRNVARAAARLAVLLPTFALGSYMGGRGEHWLWRNFRPYRTALSKVRSGPIGPSFAQALGASTVPAIALAVEPIMEPLMGRRRAHRQRREMRRPVPVKLGARGSGQAIGYLGGLALVGAPFGLGYARGVRRFNQRRGYPYLTAEDAVLTGAVPVVGPMHLVGYGEGYRAARRAYRKRKKPSIVIPTNLLGIPKDRD